MSDTIENINKAYVSPYDEFMLDFDNKHALSTSQLQEIKKHKRISYLRDNSASNDTNNPIWEKF